MQSDPIGVEDGPNTYAYVGQDVLRNFDSNGLARKNRNKNNKNNKSNSGCCGKKPKNFTPPGFGRNGAKNTILKKHGIPICTCPIQSPNFDKRGKKQPGRVYTYKTKDGKKCVIRDDSAGHEKGDLPPHFNDATNNDNDHYFY